MHSVSVELLRVQRKRTAPAAPRAPAPVPAASGAPASVEIELPNGRIIRVPPGFSSADLQRVLAIASADDPPAAPAPPGEPGPSRERPR